MRLLARREHGRAELEAKLLARLARRVPGLTRADLQATLDDLERAGLISDTRAAESLLHAKAPRYGVRRLRQALQARALPAELIAQTLQGARPSEFERACAVWQRRFGEPPADARAYAQQMRFLLARGFEPELAQRVIRAAPAA